MKTMFFLTMLACTKDQIPSRNIFKHENSKSDLDLKDINRVLDCTDYNFVQVFIIIPNINKMY